MATVKFNRATRAMRKRRRADRLARPKQVKPYVTTIRLQDTLKKGLQALEAHTGVKRPLNKWINIALAELIEKRSATIEDELEQALQNIRAYRAADPGYARAIRAFIDAEVVSAPEDPMEGSPEPRKAGPAVSIVREMLRD